MKGKKIPLVQHIANKLAINMQAWLTAAAWLSTQSKASAPVIKTIPTRD